MGEKRLSFTFEKCLGLGGFGEVYVAGMVQPGGPSRRVAVKVLKQDLQNTPEAVQRLRDEGRMLAVLDHPCIVRVLEMTLIRGRVALVTEYLEGLDLARCCKPNTRLPPKVLLGITGEVASALHCAWTTPSPETGKPLKLIHRDIKPENIRVGPYGEVKVLDFGIARTTEMYRHAKTAQGALPFTPGYAPPEAFTRGFQGSPSDVYALGVTLYRLLVGQRLYEGVELTGQVGICCLAERYAPFLQQRMDLLEAEADVKALVRQMLAYEPDARPSAQEVERRCKDLVARMEGPDLAQWARAMSFPSPKTQDGASLTGMTIEEDPIGDSRHRRANPREEHRRRSARKEGAPKAVKRNPIDPDAPIVIPLGTPAPAPSRATDDPEDDDDDGGYTGKTTLDALVERDDVPVPPAVSGSLAVRQSATPMPPSPRADVPRAPPLRRSRVPLILGVVILLLAILLAVLLVALGMLGVAYSLSS